MHYRFGLPVKLIYLLLTLFLSVTCREKTSPALSGKVVAIADGDTFTLLNNENQQERVRMYGIDCPERGQDYGNVAKEKLSEFIFRRAVRIEEKGKDRYKRTLAVVYDEDNRCVNEEMLKSGLAWHYTEYDTNPQWTRFENAARKARLGLWAQPDPTPPWEWRKAKRMKEAEK